jgi:hypothetical protein
LLTVIGYGPLVLLLGACSRTSRGNSVYRASMGEHRHPPHSPPAPLVHHWWFRQLVVAYACTSDRLCSEKALALGGVAMSKARLVATAMRSVQLAACSLVTGSCAALGMSFRLAAAGVRSADGGSGPGS